MDSKRVTRALMAALLLMATVSWSAPAQATTVTQTFTTMVTSTVNSCGLNPAGAAYCWGGNNGGQIGDNTVVARNKPTPVSGGLVFKAIGAGGTHTCGITTSGPTYCWGYGFAGKLGDGTVNNRSTPNLVSGGLNFAWVGGGSSFTCGITDTGSGYCWGDNTYGQLGDGTNTQRNVPTAISGGLTFTSMTIGEAHACGIAGVVSYCWGRNQGGRLGDNSTTDRNVPTAVYGGRTFSTLTAGGTQTCGLEAGTAYCWGFGWGGQLGTGDFNDRYSPRLVVGGLSYRAISAGGNHVCAITTSDANYCWGWGGSGEIGNGGTSNQNTPTMVSTAQKFVSIYAGGDGHNCGLSNIGVAHCWGLNSNGEIGDVTTVNRLTPVQIFYASQNSTITTVVDPSLTFIVGDNSASCNGVAVTGGTSGSGNFVALGRVTSSALAFRSQNLMVSQNGNGYSIVTKSSGPLSDSQGHTVAAWSGTNAAPTLSWAAGTEAFGYTTSDTTLGTGSAARFVGSRFAAPTTSNAEVAYDASGPTSSDTTCVGYQVGIATATPAGAYSTTMIYTAIPIY